MKKDSQIKFDPYLFESIDVGGVPVYIKQTPWANGFVYIRIQMGIGARIDPIGREGLAHFFEHLPFDGCEGYPTFDDIKKLSRNLFQDSLNAMTSLERTVFTAKVVTNRLSEALDFFASFIFKPILAESEVERERKVITQEIWRRYENEKEEELSRTLRLLEYGNHPFGRINSAAGWHDTVAKITRQELIDFHRTYYHRGNLSVILVGDIDVNTVNTTLPTFINSVPQGLSVSRPNTVNEWPLPSQQEFAISASEYFGLSGASVPKSTKIEVVRLLPILPNEFVLYIGSDMLRQALFDRIRGKLGATYSPRVNSSRFADHIVNEISVAFAPEKESDVREIIEGTLADIRKGDPALLPLFDELHRVWLERKKYIDVSVADIADDAGGELASKGRIDSIADEVVKIERVTFADVSSLYTKYFQPEMLLWEIVRV
jgi:predicted Zn-dependent peptidase